MRKNLKNNLFFFSQKIFKFWRFELTNFERIQLTFYGEFYFLKSMSTKILFNLSKMFIQSLPNIPTESKLKQR